MPSGPNRHVKEALQQVADIHAQVARSAYFRGYRAEIALGQAATAVAVAGLEAVLWERVDAATHASIWLGVAAACALASAVDLALRWRSLPEYSVTVAARQLAPALAAGLVLAPLLWGRAELLPGIWTMLFGVGLGSSAPYLPRPIRLLGAFYFVAGAVMAHAASAGLNSPWPMGLTFGGGQLVAAAILRDLQDPAPHA